MRTSLNWARHLFALGIVVLALVPRVASAEMLDEPACNHLKNEQARLAAEGLKTDILRGPEWAKSNLPQARLDQIKHLMDVEEQLQFRCPLAKPAADTAAASAGEGPSPTKTGKKKGRTKQGEETAAKPAANDDGMSAAKQPASAGEDTPKPKKKKAAAKPAATDDDTPADKAPASDEDAALKPKKKKAAAKKESANDAYVPPPPSGNAFVDGELNAVPQAPPAASPPPAAPPPVKQLPP